MILLSSSCSKYYSSLNALVIIGERERTEVKSENKIEVVSVSLQMNDDSEMKNSVELVVPFSKSYFLYFYSPLDLL